MTEQVAVVIAQAEIRANVRIQATHTNPIRVKAGAPFAIRFAYRIYEESTKEDQWVFRLAGSLGDGDEAINEMCHKDRLMVRDDIWAHLSQDHMCPAPGEYKLNFQAHATLKRRDWGDASPHQPVDDQSVGGTLTIQAV